MDNEKYTLHYGNLQLYLQLGLRVSKVHRVLRFAQKPFLPEFIDFNHKLRKQATKSFHKNPCKLFMNSNYGKTTQNPKM